MSPTAHAPPGHHSVVGRWVLLRRRRLVIIQMWAGESYCACAAWSSFSCGHVSPTAHAPPGHHSVVGMWVLLRMRRLVIILNALPGHYCMCCGQVEFYCACLALDGGNGKHAFPFTSFNNPVLKNTKVMKTNPRVLGQMSVFISSKNVLAKKLFKCVEKRRKHGADPQHGFLSPDCESEIFPNFHFAYL